MCEVEVGYLFVVSNERAWVVDAEGSVDRGVEWMENSGEDCDDI